MKGRMGISDGDLVRIVRADAPTIPDPPPQGYNGPDLLFQNDDGRSLLVVRNVCGWGMHAEHDNLAVIFMRLLTIEGGGKEFRIGIRGIDAIYDMCVSIRAKIAGDALAREGKPDAT